jgi:hypothetical protein
VQRPGWKRHHQGRVLHVAWRCRLCRGDLSRGDLHAAIRNSARKVHTMQRFDLLFLFSNEIFVCNNNNNPKELPESCDNVKCGAGKRCIMKRGQPKCICSPQCKAATATINKNRKVGVNEEFTEMRNRHYSVVRPPVVLEMQNDEPTLDKGAAGARRVNHSSEALASDGTNSSARTLEWRIRSKINSNQILHVDEFYLGSIVSAKLQQFYHKKSFFSLFHPNSQNLLNTVPFAAPMERHIKMNVNCKSVHADKRIKSWRFSIKASVRVSRFNSITRHDRERGRKRERAKIYVKITRESMNECMTYNRKVFLRHTHTPRRDV